MIKRNYFFNFLINCSFNGVTFITYGRLKQSLISYFCSVVSNFGPNCVFVFDKYSKFALVHFAFSFQIYLIITFLVVYYILFFIFAIILQGII